MSLEQNQVRGLSSPPSFAFQIVPDDAADLPKPTRGLMVGTAGDVAMITLAGDTIVLPGLLPGVQYAIRARRILATGTLAANIVGLA
ncbi:spike base protein, RCAP_Rcc01079 family [Maricaulis parjimensis]|uniref:spike base protein, RCAP_Rcc01079 family n=1 Tax=Maricaulis parjimensis TaxID=144023 RepID=UPI001939C031|nr:hypothetical protein [Maricaulis parjimensis]